MIVAMKLLLVEDEYELALVIKAALEVQAHTVDVLEDGISAQEVLQGFTYDLLIVDWMLPELSGIELCQWMRKVGMAIPILMLTARDTVEDRVIGLDSGVDDYLIKPFDLQELRARVRALGRRRTTALASETLHFADLKLDTRILVAWRQDKEIVLTRKEFQLLELLMRHPRQVLSQEQIFDHLWEMGADPESNVIAAQIRLLRRKIDAGFAFALIHTVYGLGYRLAEK
jgi:two-component system, OmpR family, manganese sensing response regulator